MLLHTYILLPDETNRHKPGPLYTILCSEWSIKSAPLIYAVGVVYDYNGVDW